MRAYTRDRIADSYSVEDHTGRTPLPESGFLHVRVGCCVIPKFKATTPGLHPERVAMYIEGNGRSTGEDTLKSRKM